MKTSLDELTVTEFVALFAGDHSVLCGQREICDPGKLAETARRITLEYHSIADPAGSAAFIVRLADIVRAHIGYSMFSMCENLLSMGQADGARDILDQYGISCDGWPESRLRGEIKMRMARCEKELTEAGADRQEPSTPKEIRAHFDALSAALMAYFKFQIDPATMKASIYANLIARMSAEMRAKVAAAKSGRV